MIRHNTIIHTSLWALALTAACLTSPAVAQPPAGYVETSINLGVPSAAVAYAPDGTLYVVEGAPYGSSAATINVIEPNGTLGPAITVSAASSTPGPAFGGFYSVGGATWDANAGTLLVTDGAPGNGALYSINPSTGAATTVAAGGTYFPVASGGEQFIQEVAVQPATGNILISDATGPGQGGIYQVTPINGSLGSLTPVVTGLDYAAGLGFDASGNLLYQESKYDASASIYPGNVFQAPITSSGNPLTVGPATTLNSNTGAFDLAFATDHNVYVTGNGGLFQINPSTLATTQFDSDGNPFQFATSLSFLAGSGTFSPFAGPQGGHLAYIPEFNNSSILVITPAAVPEPSSLVLAAVGGCALLFVARRRRAARAG